ncbi:hypothetical protein ALI144C_14000 [Actinosynnema sp. ALI-1.44]|uniref:hypothetical protein n=1 Tax=Actinosynnema sp. ALI-1.44 TaxID=1933779 RepID=UPI00097BF5E0|nr:hypothetical protein [Actinosynnema sp. ALI-1.44]ONI85386.1 hypothetical protein ALI144C_14000 [Actinosynnema sp. ALI-1.44]
MLLVPAVRCFGLSAVVAAAGEFGIELVQHLRGDVADRVLAEQGVDVFAVIAAVIVLSGASERHHRDVAGDQFIESRCQARAFSLVHGPDQP